MGDAGGCGREAGRYGERYDPFLHLSRGHYYTAQPCSGNLRHLPSLLTITCHFVSLLTVSSAHTKTKKPKSVNLCSAQLISAHLRRAHGQKTNKKTGPGSAQHVMSPIIWNGLPYGPYLDARTDQARIGVGVDRASSLYRDGDHSVNILVAPEQILKQYEKPSPGHISGLNIVKHT